jgi:capsular exopolysaccharide synthesis family protein
MSDITLRAPRPVEAPAIPQALEWLRAVRRHGLTFSATAGLVMAAAAVVTYSLPIRYTATARVYVSPQTPDPLQPGEAARGLADDEITTVSELLQSRDVAEQVVSHLPVAPAAPAAPAGPTLIGAPAASGRTPDAAHDLAHRIDLFLAALTATPEERSRVIDLKYTDSDPVRAANSLNTLVQDFQQQQIKQTADDLQRTSAWLSQRAEALRDRWLQAAARVGEFRAAHGLANGGGAGPEGQTLVSQQIGHAAADLATAQAELAAARARQAAMRAAPDASSAAQVADSPAVVAATTQLEELEGRQASLRAAYGPMHPSVQGINRQVAAARASLGAATAHARHAIDTDVAARQAAVAALTANLTALRRAAGSQSGSEVGLTTLTNEAADARTAYEAFLVRAKQLDDRTQLVEPQVHFASHAVVPNAPSFPNTPRFLLAGFVLGLMAGVAAALAREYTQRGFANISRVSDALSLPLLSAIPLLPAGRLELPHYLGENPFSHAAESVRTLVAGLQFNQPGGEAPRSVVIASATGSEGKTTIAIWLAHALAAAGQRVLLIDGDHRRGAVADRLGGRQSMGFTDLIAGASSGPAVTQRAVAGYDYIASGTPSARVLGPAELTRLRSALTAYREQYDMVIIDTPPLLAMTEALLFARAADATVFVCRWNSTARQAVSASLDRLEQAGAKLAGVALTMVDHARLALFSDEHRSRDVRLIEGYYRHH